MKITKRYDKHGNLVFAHIDLTMKESQPDWIIEAAKQREAREKAKTRKKRRA